MVKTQENQNIGGFSTILFVSGKINKIITFFANERAFIFWTNWGGGEKPPTRKDMAFLQRDILLVVFEEVSPVR